MVKQTYRNRSHCLSHGMGRCFAQPRADDIKVAIGMAGGVNQVPSLVAKAKGFFKEEGLDVDVKALPRGSIAIDALQNGSLQFAEAANAAFFHAVDKGVPLVAFGVGSRGYTGKLLVANRNAKHEEAHRPQRQAPRHPGRHRHVHRPADAVGEAGP